MDAVRPSYTHFRLPEKTLCSGRRDFEMSDGEPRLLVGTPTKSGDNITLLAERIFRVPKTDVEIYEKEMLAMHETLQGDEVLPVPQKRAAHEMIEETPSKKFALAFCV